MDAPEELQWAVAEALFDASDDLRPEDNWPDDDAKYGRAAAAVLAVPVVRDALARDAQAQKAAADAVWMAKLARSGSWPGGMAQAVDSAAERVIRALGTDDDRAALDAVSAALCPSPGDRDDSEEQK